MSARHLSLLAAAAAAAALVAVGAIVFSLLPGERAGGSGAALIGGPFELVDQAGRTVTDEAYAGSLLLVYFGYTFCPDVCPTELATMSDALDRLGDDADQVRALFVTVDPARDTVPVVADYVAHFHPRMAGLTGTPEQVAAAAKAYRVYYAKGEGADDAYLMDHSSFVYLMDRDGTYLAHFPPQTAPGAMAQRIRQAL